MPARRLAHPVVMALIVASLPAAQSPTPNQSTPTRASILRGEYGRYRANNDLLHYHLDVRVDPEKKVIGGKNTIRFRMLQDDTRIQLDLYANLSIDQILLVSTRGATPGITPLKYERELNAAFVDFPDTLRKGREYAIEFHYSGTPQQQEWFGGFVFQKDPSGRQWVYYGLRGRRLEHLVAQQGSSGATSQRAWTSA